MSRKSVDLQRSSRNKLSLLTSLSKLLKCTTWKLNKRNQVWSKIATCLIRCFKLINQWRLNCIRKMSSRLKIVKYLWRQIVPPVESEDFKTYAHQFVKLRSSLIFWLYLEILFKGNNGNSRRKIWIRARIFFNKKLNESNQKQKRSHSIKLFPVFSSFKSQYTSFK